MKFAVDATGDDFSPKISGRGDVRLASGFLVNRNREKIEIEIGTMEKASGGAEA